MRKALAALALLASPLALATDLGGDGLGGPSLQPRAQSAQLGEPGIANREVAQVDPVLIEAGEPALDFRFAKNKSLIESTTNASSMITFARSAAQSPGTYVGADGLIHDAAVNNLLYSEQFDQSVWSLLGGTTRSANQAIAPDGKQTADFVTFTAPSSNNIIYQRFNGTITTGQSYTASIWVRADSNTQTLFGLNGVSNANNNDGNIFDVTTEWKRISYTFTAFSDTGLYFQFGSKFSTVGNKSVPAHSLYVWGAQLQESTTPTAYIHTTSQALAAPRFDHDPVTRESLGLLVEEARTNLVTYSEDFSNAAWNNTDIAYYPTTETVDPTGQTNAYKIDPSDKPSESYSIFSSSSVSGSFSVFLKEGTERYALIIRGTYASGDYAVFDLQSGTITQSPTFSGSTATIVDAGNGWYRCTIISAQATTVNAFSVSGAATGLSTASSGYVYIYGAQLESGGTFPTSYIPTEGSAQTRYADVAAVQDEDFSTTNLLAYSESFTSWGDTNISRDSATETAPDGQATALQVSASSANGTVIYPAAMGTSAERVFSIYLRRVTGTGDIQYTLDNGSNWTTQTITSTWQRYIFPKTTAAQRPGIRIVTSGDAIEMWGASLTATEYPVAYTTTRNLLTDSQDFERSTWVKTAAVGNIISSYSDPFGDNDATRLIDDNAGGTGVVYLSKSVTVATSTQKTFSVYAKADQLNWAHLAAVNFTSPASGGVYFDLSSGAIGASSAGITGQSENIGNGWYRISITFTTDSSDTSGDLRVYAANADGNVVVDRDSTSSIFIHGAQFEPGTTPTEYVRTVDTVGKDYGWYEPTEGTVWAEFIVDAPAGSRMVAVLSDGSNGSAQNEIRAVSIGGGFSGMYVKTLNATQADLFQSASVTVGDVTGHIAAFKHNSFAYRTNTGMTLKTDNSGTVPVVTKLFLGGYEVSGTVFSGRIRRLTYWPRRQSDSTLQVITQ